MQVGKRKTRFIECCQPCDGQSGVVNRVSPDRGKLVTLIGGVCVQHSSEARVTVLLWPLVAARCLVIDTDIVTTVPGLI